MGEHSQRSMDISAHTDLLRTNHSSANQRSSAVEDSAHAGVRGAPGERATPISQPVAANTRSDTGVAVSLNATPLETAYRALSLKVEAALPASSNTQAGARVGAATYAADDFTPAAVTDRIMTFIEARLQRAKAEGANEDDIKTLYQQALSGLEQGLSEARDQLSAMASWTGEQQTTFNDTVNQLADGMTKLADDLWSEPTAGVTSGAPVNIGMPTSKLTTAAANATQINSAEDTYTLEILTRDGDTARIQISRSALASQSSEGQLNVRQQSFSMEVTGTLDEQEMAAIDDLMQQVNDVASTFFSGDVDAALEQALQVGMDTSELSAFAANMGKQSAAIRTHLPGYDTPPNGSGTSPVSAARQAMASAQQAATRVMDAQAFLNGDSMDQLLTDGRKLFQGLITQLGELTGASAASQDFFNQLWGLPERGELPERAPEMDLTPAG